VKVLYRFRVQARYGGKQRITEILTLKTEKRDSADSGEVSLHDF
jgi:hypothetical protein